jgi:hypothetical protein
MTKLTRYTSFSNLKLSENSINPTGSDHSIELLEFEEFINALRKSIFEEIMIGITLRPGSVIISHLTISRIFAICFPIVINFEYCLNKFPAP